MAEALGLAIGAVGLLPMVCKMYRNCHETAQSVRYHSRELRYAAEKLFIQRNLFDRECRYLLQNIVSEEIAKEMIQDHVHPAWSGPTFLVDLENFVGKDFEIHFRHIRDSLEAVGCLLKKAMDQPSCQVKLSNLPEVAGLGVDSFLLPANPVPITLKESSSNNLPKATICAHGEGEPATVDRAAQSAEY